MRIAATCSICRHMKRGACDPFQSWWTWSKKLENGSIPFLSIGRVYTCVHRASKHVALVRSIFFFFFISRMLSSSFLSLSLSCFFSPRSSLFSPSFRFLSCLVPDKINSSPLHSILVSTAANNGVMKKGGRERERERVEKPFFFRRILSRYTIVLRLFGRGI